MGHAWTEQVRRGELSLFSSPLSAWFDTALRAKIFLLFSIFLQSKIYSPTSLFSMHWLKDVLPNFLCFQWSVRTTGLPERQVERWKRRKASLSRWTALGYWHKRLRIFVLSTNLKNPTQEVFRPSTLDKFAETGWRWLFYFSAHVFRFHPQKIYWKKLNSIPYSWKLY